MPKLPPRPAPAPAPTEAAVVRPDDFFAGTVVEEMARRLRGAGLWDNTLGDGLAVLAARAAALERLGRFAGHAYGRIDRPLRSWADARKLLAVVCSSNRATFTDVPAGVADCLTAAVLLDRWEAAAEPLPSDLRTVPGGALVVEWEKPYRVVMVTGGVIR